MRNETLGSVTHNSKWHVVLRALTLTSVNWEWDTSEGRSRGSWWAGMAALLPEHSGAEAEESQVNGWSKQYSERKASLGTAVSSKQPDWFRLVWVM